MKFWSCRDVARMMASGEFDETSGARKLLAQIHLLGCRHCRKFLRQMRLLGQAIRLSFGRLRDSATREALEGRLIARLKA